MTTARYSVGEADERGDPLRPGASPHAIRAALLPEDRQTFDDVYDDDLATARRDLDLTDLFVALERGRRIAILHRDPDRFRSVARRAAELRTGAPSPEDEPLEVTRAEAGL